MSEYGWGIVVGVVAMFAVGAVANLVQWWVRRRAARRFMRGVDGEIGQLMAGSLGAGQMSSLDLEALKRDLTHGGLLEAPEPPEPPAPGVDVVPEDPADWQHVWAYVDGFAHHVARFREVKSVVAHAPRPALSFTTNVYRYDAAPPTYVGHPEVEAWLGWFGGVVVAGFADDLTYTLQEVEADLADCVAQLKALLERVGPPRKRSVTARLQGQINEVLNAAAREREERHEISRTKSTFGAGSFGGDPQPGSSPLG